MADRRVVFHPEAEAEAEAAHSWYQERSAAASDAFLSELRFGVTQISSAPHRWPPYLARTRRYLLKRFPFSVVYRETEGLIRVLAVAHQKRRADYWIRRK